MNNENFEQHRIAALDLFESLKDEYGTEDLSAELQATHKNIMDNKFLLAIMGEVNAGKSTFINAILGENILPTDTCQATAAIIEIFKDDKKFFTVTYASGHKTKVTLDQDTHGLNEEAVKILKEIAAVTDKYKDLPIVQLNDFIIKRYNASTEKAEYTEEELDQWIETSSLDNIRQLEKEEFEKKIRIYIDENKNGNTIPKQISIGFPNNFEFDQFRLVDTPGIRALGGIEVQTKRFINKADAIIYLHKETATAIALQEAWDNEITQKAKEHLLLALTYRSDRITEDADKMLEEARDIFKQIDKSRIYSIDSLTELALKQFYGKEWNEIGEIRKADKKIKRVTADAWEDADGDIAVLLNLLEEQSNMRGLIKAIKELSNNAVSIQLKSFMNGIKEHFDEVATEIRNKLGAYKSKFEDPPVFAEQIKKEVEEMQLLRNENSEFSDRIISDYSLKSATNDFYKNYEKIFENFICELNGKSFDRSDNTRKSVESYVEKIYEDLNDSMSEFKKNIQEQVNDEIKKNREQQVKNYSQEIPISPSSKIWDTAEDKATSEEQYEENRKGFWSNLVRYISFNKMGKEKKTRQVFKLKIYWDSIRNDLLPEIGEEKAKWTEKIDSFLRTAINQFKELTNKKLEERELFLEDLKKNQVSNQELQKKIQEKEEKLKGLNMSISKCNEIMGEL